MIVDFSHFEHTLLPNCREFAFFGAHIILKSLVSDAAGPLDQ